MGKSREGQNILDYAIQEFGSVENAIQVIDAGGFSLSDEIPAGTDLELTIENNGDESIKGFYAKNKLVPNNATPIIQGDAYSGAYSNAYN